MRIYKIISAILLVMLNSACFATAPLDKKAVNEFIDYMHTAYEFDSAELKSVFDETVKSQKVLNAISRPAERLPWYEYRKIFIQNDRVDGGIDFWQRNKETLARAEETYGVPAHIIVAIIGVETRYGSYTGGDRVMDALSTLAFHYPKRSKFFSGRVGTIPVVDPGTESGSPVNQGFLCWCHGNAAVYPEQLQKLCC